MNSDMQAVALQCLQGAEQDSMKFPEIVATLMKAGFEGYQVDLRRATAIYFAADGSSVELKTLNVDGSVMQEFDASAVRAAIKEAQQQVPGYTYKGFCQKMARAGCAGYIVSFTGRRALYFGRTAETHTEHFPR